jgi:hypothetical protein
MGLEAQSEEREMKIIGAGLAGLLCGALNPGSVIYEAQPSLPNNHGAVLRFRDDKISKALNIPFRKVRVTKGIWWNDIGIMPHLSIPLQNTYSRKVTGEYHDRSINNLDTVTRYIAPHDFTQQLADRCRINYNHSWSSQSTVHGPIVSTIPMPVMLKSVMTGSSLLEFKRRPIYTRVFTFPETVDLYQTIYFPDPDAPLYRASMTGNKMICEYTEHKGHDHEIPVGAFGMEDGYCVDVGVQVKKQEYGKIIELAPEKRRALIGMLSHEHQIYSLGRYATWRNILLDDVFDDIFTIQRLMRMDAYTRRIAAS